MPKKTNILIAEDDDLLRGMYITKFTKDGFNAHGVAFGNDVFNEVEVFKPDVILLDILMPNEDGFDILKQLKASRKTKAIPVIILSNLGDNVTVQKALWLGAENYLIKAELLPEQVVQKVKDILSGKESKQELDPHVIELFEHEERAK